MIGQDIERIDDLLLGGLIDAGEGLVQHHQARILRQRSRNEDASPLPAAQLADLTVGQPIQTEVLKDITHNSPIDLARPAKPADMPAAPHHHHIKDRCWKSPVYRALLRHITDIGMAAMGIFAVDRDAPAADLHDADNSFEQRALAGAIWTDDGDPLARLHLEADVVQRMPIALITG